MSSDSLRLLAHAFRFQVIEQLDTLYPDKAWDRCVGFPHRYRKAKSSSTVSFWFPLEPGILWIQLEDIGSAILLTLERGLTIDASQVIQPPYGYCYEPSIYRYDIAVPDSIDEFLSDLSRLIQGVMSNANVARP